MSNVLLYFNEPFGSKWKHNRDKRRWELVVDNLDDDLTEGELSDYLQGEIEEEIFSGNWGWDEL